MTLLGLALALAGAVTGTAALWILGTILAAAGLILVIAGRASHPAAREQRRLQSRDQAPGRWLTLYL